MDARAQTLREEIANALSHGLGFLLALASLPVLVEFASRHGSSLTLASAVVFSGTMMLLYLVSAVYHALPPGRWKSRFNRLDHAAIFLFIAGSYTPFVLGPLRGAWGWALFGAVWTLAGIGVAAKVLGWMALVAIEPMLERIAAGGLVLIVGGGAAYTVGALFFLLDERVRYAHFVWHLFVLAGSTCHFLAALWYGLAPPPL